MDQKTRERPSVSKTSYDFSVCPTCKGVGMIVFSQEGYEDGQKACFASPCPTCKGGLDVRTETVKRLSDIPSVYYDKGYQSFNWNIYRDSDGKQIDMSKRRMIVEDFLKNYRKWKSKGYGLYLNSKTKGTGKTFLASCICNELMELYGIRTKFVNATKILDISKSGDKESPDIYKREPIRLLSNCELLVLDDIGQKKNGENWINEVMFTIVDDRMNNGLVTLYTSNLEVGALPLDPRIIDRISKTSISMTLPEYNVRLNESYDDKVIFLKDIGVIKERGG